jgi:hypothetical protein
MEGLTLLSDSFINAGRGARQGAARFCVPSGYGLCCVPGFLNCKLAQTEVSCVINFGFDCQLVG